MFLISVSFHNVACVFVCFFFFQAEDGIRDLVRSRGLGDVYKRQKLAQIIGQQRGAYPAALAQHWQVEPLKDRPALSLSLIHI